MKHGVEVSDRPQAILALMNREKEGLKFIEGSSSVMSPTWTRMRSLRARCNSFQ